MNRKLSSTRGFTLAELLIVVAIIAVLVAIAIPVFNSQLEKSREATDIANVRSAYAEVMTAAITEDKTATYNDTVMYDSKTDRYIAVVSPLAQKRPKWQTWTPITIGGVSSGADGGFNGLDTWNGEPQPGGSCTIICGRDGAVIFNWSDTDSPTNPDTPDNGNISDKFDNSATEFPKDGFTGEEGKIYKFNGKLYVCVYAQKFDAGGTPDNWYSAQFCELSSSAKIYTDNDLIDRWDQKLVAWTKVTVTFVRVAQGSVTTSRPGVDWANERWTCYKSVSGALEAGPPIGGEQSPPFSFEPQITEVSRWPS